jgi:hypothetical protein
MISSRNSVRGSIAALVFLALAMPASAQDRAGTFGLAGMTNAALWASTASAMPPAAVTAVPSTSKASVGTTRHAYLSEEVVAPVGPVSRVVQPVAPQEESGGGFPWLEVGIGAAVGALFIQAVATANSGDAAELPRGGVSIVLPSS